MRGRILLDTNLLILLAVGAYDVSFISSHKRSNKFDTDDYETLTILLDGQTLVLTTHILTEASNLLWQTSEPHGSSIRYVLKQIVSKSEELCTESVGVMETSNFLPLGLTDAAILALGEPELEILTDDLDLHLAALELNLKTVNFNHYRSF